MAAEPSLRHFTEVTFYALALARALDEQGLSDRYAVSAEGFIWPGTHDENAFRNLILEHRSRGDLDPLTTSLLQTLTAVPYEVYQVHVKQFFENRLLRVLRQPIEGVEFHVGPACQLCEYLKHCSSKAQETDHLSRIAWLTRGQADLLRDQGIASTEQLVDAIQNNTPAWQRAVGVSPQLRADAPALRARAESLNAQEVRIAEGRKVASMPRFTEMSIFITVHFDLGSGVTFALGASRVYWAPGRPEGAPPLREHGVFIVERVDGMNTDREKLRLVEFLRLLTRWFQEAHDYNVTLHAQRRAAGIRDGSFGKIRAHVFSWDGLEITQLRRMLARHMDDDDVVGLVEVLVRMFPPDNLLPDPEMFRSQPGTVVKEVFKQLVGVPVPHDYTLLEVANAFHPRILPDTGSPYRYRLPYGFVTEMSDQIPFERAYELWGGRPQLRNRIPISQTIGSAGHSTPGGRFTMGSRTQ